MIKYPYLEKWIYEHSTVKHVAAALGVSQSHLYHILDGTSTASKTLKQKILKLTKLPEEICFAEKVVRAT